MRCSRTQLTLDPKSDDFLDFAKSLGLTRVITWYALERCPIADAPLTTSAALGLRYVSLLEEAGVVTLRNFWSPGYSRSTYDRFFWRRRPDLGSSAEVLEALGRVLKDLGSDPRFRYRVFELWDELAAAELEAYLANLLRRHQFEPRRASQLISAMDPDWEPHSLGRRRYLAWYGMRGASAALLRFNMDEDAAIACMLEEMRRRSRWLLENQPQDRGWGSNYCFLPGSGWRKPLIIEALQEFVLPGDQYWSASAAAYMRP